MRGEAKVLSLASPIHSTIVFNSGLQACAPSNNTKVIKWKCKRFNNPEYRTMANKKNTFGMIATNREKARAFGLTQSDPETVKLVEDGYSLALGLIGANHSEESEESQRVSRFATVDVNATKRELNAFAKKALKDSGLDSAFFGFNGWLKGAEQAERNAKLIAVAIAVAKKAKAAA